MNRPLAPVAVRHVQSQDAEVGRRYSRNMGNALRWGLTCLIALALAVSLATPASAGSKVRRDPATDAAAKYDLLAGKYVNSRSVLRATIRVRDLKNVATWVRVTTSTPAMRRDNAQFELNAKRLPGGRKSHSMHVRQGGYWSRIQCRGMRVTWRLGREQVIVKVPQLCLGEGHGQQRMYTNVGAPNRRPADTLTRTEVPYA